MTEPESQGAPESRIRIPGGAATAQQILEVRAVLVSQLWEALRMPLTMAWTEALEAGWLVFCGSLTHASRHGIAEQEWTLRQALFERLGLMGNGLAADLLAQGDAAFIECCGGRPPTLWPERRREVMQSLITALKAGDSAAAQREALIQVELDRYELMAFIAP
ncbi:hypothetical protein OU995_05180 [Roseateles sp. SL47]|uniref:hypothetical protein n=1 Tax=Roseateles sp. SL47 TaxID=2995138 RepID=UPI0022710DAB|nr:hypothetical protein [Roseateles sp. SL47]WAC74124.1 hypothetical protein OU995_05180 [Roseateles sp. SL47]